MDSFIKNELKFNIATAIGEEERRGKRRKYHTVEQISVIIPHYNTFLLKSDSIIRHFNAPIIRVLIGSLVKLVVFLLRKYDKGMSC